MSYKKRGKFNNRKIIIDGLVFDSKLEGKRYKELKLMEQKRRNKGSQTSTLLWTYTKIQKKQQSL